MQKTQIIMLLIIFVLMLGGCAMPSESYHAQETTALLGPGGLNALIDKLNSNNPQDKQAGTLALAVMGFAVVAVIGYFLGFFKLLDWWGNREREQTKRERAQAAQVAATMAAMERTAAAAMKSATPTVNHYNVTINTDSTAGLLPGASRVQLSAPQVYTMDDLNAVLNDAHKQVAQLNAPER